MDCGRQTSSDTFNVTDQDTFNEYSVESIAEKYLKLSSIITFPLESLNQVLV